MPPRNPDDVQRELSERETGLMQTPGVKVIPSAGATSPEDKEQIKQLQYQVQQLTERLVEITAVIAGGGPAPSGAAAVVPAGSGVSAGDRKFLEGLALALRQVDDQGRPAAKRTVAPEVLAQRADAREKMVDALLEARANGETPEYEVMNACYLDDQLVEPFYENARLFAGNSPDHPSWLRNDVNYNRTRIGFSSVPNEAMRPVNAVARRIHGYFIESIGGGTAKVVEDPLVGKLDRLAQEDGSGVSTLQHRQKPAPVRVLGTIHEPAIQS